MVILIRPTCFMIRITIIVKMTTDYTETKYITAKYLLNIEYFIGHQGSQLLLGQEQ